nr:hypothetical protein [Guopingia tenuis]
MIPAKTAMPASKFLTSTKKYSASIIVGQNKKNNPKLHKGPAACYNKNNSAFFAPQRTRSIRADFVKPVFHSGEENMRIVFFAGTEAGFEALADAAGSAMACINNNSGPRRICEEG